MSTCTHRHSYNYHQYYDKPSDHEYRIEVPPVTSDDTRQVVLRISAVGGGAVGNAYANNSWAYSLSASAGLVEQHDDNFRLMRTYTHAEAARALAKFLAADSPLYDRLLAFSETEPDAASEFSWTPDSAAWQAENGEQGTQCTVSAIAWLAQQAQA